MRQGRPLRFLAHVLGGWAGLRIAILLLPLSGAGMEQPQVRRATAVATSGGALTVVAAAATMIPMDARLVAAQRARGESRPSSLPPALSAGAGAMEPPTAAPMRAEALAFTRAAPAPHGLDLAAYAPGGGLVLPAGMLVDRAGHAAPGERWSGVAWVLWRPDGAAGLARGGQLGGSQAGMRIDYALRTTALGRLTAYGRASAALGRPRAGEGALGLALRPSRTVPLSLAVERRQRLSEGGRNAFALYAAGGIDPRPVGAGLELEGYGQGGIVGLRSADGFVDGRVSLARRLSGADEVDLALGGSVSGAAQPGLSRLDMGPEVRLRLPVGFGRVRLGAEWRHRVVGDARPASGPAFTLIGEF